MTKWGMVIDLNKCIGCNSCAVACKDINKLPFSWNPHSMWKSVLDCGVSENPERLRMFLHISCMHCSEPPCLNVCPTKATYRRPDGIVGISYEKCIGCGYCIIACPYRARTIFTKEFDFEVRSRSNDPVRVSDDRVGICTKCDFCSSKIDLGLTHGLKPGIDPEATPACVISCSSNAISFGDLNDSNSNVAKLIQENRVARLQEQLGTNPSVYFIIYEGFFRVENKK